MDEVTRERFSGRENKEKTDFSDSCIEQNEKIGQHPQYLPPYVGQELLDKKPVNLLVMEVACNDKKEDSESTRCRASVKNGVTLKRELPEELSMHSSSGQAETNKSLKTEGTNLPIIDNSDCMVKPCFVMLAQVKISDISEHSPKLETMGEDDTDTGKSRYELRKRMTQPMKRAESQTDMEADEHHDSESDATDEDYSVESETDTSGEDSDFIPPNSKRERSSKQSVSTDNIDSGKTGNAPQHYLICNPPQTSGDLVNSLLNRNDSSSLTQFNIAPFYNPQESNISIKHQVGESRESGKEKAVHRHHDRKEVKKAPHNYLHVNILHKQKRDEACRPLNKTDANIRNYGIPGGSRKAENAIEQRKRMYMNNYHDKYFIYGDKETSREACFLAEVGMYASLGKLHMRSFGKADAQFFKYMRWNADHRCVVCKTVFSSVSKFVEHCVRKSQCSKHIYCRDSIQNKSRFHCPPCNKSFEDLALYLKHMFREKYHGEQKIICNIPRRNSKTYRKLIRGFIKKGPSTYDLEQEMGSSASELELEGVKIGIYSELEGSTSILKENIATIEIQTTDGEAVSQKDQVTDGPTSVQEETACSSSGALQKSDSIAPIDEANHMNLDSDHAGIKQTEPASNLACVNQIYPSSESQSMNRSNPTFVSHGREESTDVRQPNIEPRESQTNVTSKSSRVMHQNMVLESSSSQLGDVSSKSNSLLKLHHLLKSTIFYQKDLVSEYTSILRSHQTHSSSTQVDVTYDVSDKTEPSTWKKEGTDQTVRNSHSPPTSSNSHIPADLVTVNNRIIETGITVLKDSPKPGKTGIDLTSDPTDADFIMVDDGSRDTEEVEDRNEDSEAEDVGKVDSDSHLKFVSELIEKHFSFKAGYECLVCKPSMHKSKILHIFTNCKYALRHIKIVHTKDIKGATEKQRAKYLKAKKSRGKLCEYCGKQIGDCSQRGLVYHIRTWHPERAAEKNVEKPLKCLYCPMEFEAIRRSAFRQHMRKHTKPKVKCEICGKLVKSMKNHKSVHKTEELKCLICFKVFTNKNNLTSHRKYHERERKYQCDQCSKSFLAKHHLKNHMLTHTDDWPFMCSVCGERFRMKHHLESHTKRKHSQ